MHRYTLSKEARIGLAWLGSLALVVGLLTVIFRSQTQIAHADRVITRDLPEQHLPEETRYIGEPHDKEHVVALSRCMDDDLNDWRDTLARATTQDETYVKLFEIVTACRVRLFGQNSVQTLPGNWATPVPLIGGMLVPDGNSEEAKAHRHIMAVHECMNVRWNAWFATEGQPPGDQQRQKRDEIGNACEAWLK